MFKTKHKLVPYIFHKLFARKQTCKYTLKTYNILKPLKKRNNFNFQSLITSYLEYSSPKSTNITKPKCFKHFEIQLKILLSNSS